MQGLQKTEKQERQKKKAEEVEVKNIEVKSPAKTLYVIGMALIWRTVFLRLIPNSEIGWESIVNYERLWKLTIGMRVTCFSVKLTKEIAGFKVSLNEK